MRTSLLDWILGAGAHVHRACDAVSRCTLSAICVPHASDEAVAEVVVVE
jgi:hypothetical protein